MVLIGSWITHLFGGSAGREGTALQMSGSLADGLSRVIRLRPSDRRLLLIASLGGGFGAVFGVPLAGAVFALEVQAIGRVRYEAIVPTLTASVVGDQIVRGLGYQHTAHLSLSPTIDAWLIVKLVNTPIAYNGMRRSTFASVASRSTMLASASEITPLEKTSRWPRLVSWRGMKLSPAWKLASRGKSA